MTLANQKDYKDVVRLYREKIRTAEAKLELHLTTAIKDHKKTSINTSRKKVSINTSATRRAKEYLHPLLDAGGTA